MKVYPSDDFQLNQILSGMSEYDILAHYFDITSLPTVIKSPLREDKHPSFSIYSNNNKVYYKDFATGEHGDIYNLIEKCFGLSYYDVRNEMALYATDIDDHIINHSTHREKKFTYNKYKGSNTSDIKVRVREWMQHDIDYWKSYGIPLQWLKYVEVYPIDYKIVYKNGCRYCFKADKYAYVFVERKENNVTLKVYQPFNKNGYKWSNKNDHSVVGLWSKVPQNGDRVIICSSLKDALCMWCNTKIPCIYVQSETTGLSDTAIKVLKQRYKKIYILFDNDEAGLKDGYELSKKTGFTNLILPFFDEGKDISDLYKAKGKEEFLRLIKTIFYNK
jgi:hypothetical protein